MAITVCSALLARSFWRLLPYQRYPRILCLRARANQSEKSSEKWIWGNGAVCGPDMLTHSIHDATSSPSRGSRGHSCDQPSFAAISETEFMPKLDEGLHHGLPRKLPGIALTHRSTQQRDCENNSELSRSHQCCKPNRPARCGYRGDGEIYESDSYLQDSRKNREVSRNKQS